MDAVALLQGRIMTVPSGLLVKVLDDALLVYTHFGFGGEPETMGSALRQVLGASLDSRHDARGVLVFADAAEPRSLTYAGVVEEIGGAATWVPIVPDGHVLAVYAKAPPGSTAAMMGELLASISPSIRSRLNAAMKSGDKAAFAALEAEMVEAFGGEAAAEKLNANFPRILKSPSPRSAPGRTARGRSFSSARSASTSWNARSARGA